MASRGRRAGSAGVAGAVCLALGLVAPTTASADHGGPSASAVAASKARVAKLERQVAAAADAVTKAQDRLDQMRTQAEVAVESFDRAQVVEAEAARALAAAQLVVAAADGRVRDARTSLDHFAVAAYEGGTLSSLDALVTSNGPDSMLYRLGALDAVSRSQRDVVESLHGATVFDGVVRREAADQLDRAQAAAVTAERAKQKAQHAVTSATSAVTAVTAAQHGLASMLKQAQAHASALERARLAALARARAEAAAAAARRAAAARAAQLRAQQPGDTFVSSSGGATVSAPTEQAAVQQAEAQIGKPYQWGAAGPDTYDCSGLVMWAYAQVGVQVDHWTGYQWNEGVHIALSELRPGDLVFFATDTSNPDTIHHVGMYIGNGEMVEAPYTGADERISPAFRPDLIGAVRFYA